MLWKRPFVRLVHFFVPQLAVYYSLLSAAYLSSCLAPYGIKIYPAVDLPDCLRKAYATYHTTLGPLQAEIFPSTRPKPGQSREKASLHRD